MTNWETLSNSEIVKLVTAGNCTDNELCELGDLVMAAIGMHVAGLQNDITRFAALVKYPAVESAIYEVYA